MTIQELQAALISMPPGTKFTHPYFSKDEFIYRDSSGWLRDELGYYLVDGEFFSLRMESMADGWEIYDKMS